MLSEFNLFPYLPITTAEVLAGGCFELPLKEKVDEPLLFYAVSVSASDPP